MRILNQPKEVQHIFSRSKRILIVVFISFLILLARMAYLQIYKGDELYIQSKNNFILSEKILPARGDIVSADGKMLATTLPAFKISIIPVFFSSRDMIHDQVGRVASLLNFSLREKHNFEKKLTRCHGSCRYVPMTLKDEISKKNILKVASYFSNFPGIIISSSYKRSYPFGEKACHITGYISKISEREKKKNKNFDPESFVGKTGLEKYYEKELHGTYGKIYHVIDHMGRKIEPNKVIEKQLPKNKPSVKGATIKTTILSYLQEEAFDAFNNQSGAIVVIEIKTGNVLALYSSPGFDPNLLSGKVIKPAIWNQYSKSILNPLYNKAISSSFYPGSTFKVIPAMAGLFYKKITPKTEFLCEGCLSFGKETKCCWNRHGHGWVNLRKSLKESCDIYYYLLSQKLGIDDLTTFAKLFNIGRLSGIDLPSEDKGILPTPQWFKMNYPGKRISSGYVMNLAIGQGDLRMTPLQLAMVYAGIANNGIIMQPKIAKEIDFSDGKKRIIKDTVLRKLDVNPKIFKSIMSALWAVVNEPGGTAFYHADRTIPQAAGKTGTSQIISKHLRRKIDRTDEEKLFLTKDDALFAAIFPYKNPEIAAVAIVEHGGHGGSTAAPIVFRVLKAYYTKTSSEIKNREQEIK